MGLLAQETIEQVKRDADIVSVISAYVSLKQKGRNFVGLCPFHSEKSGSFTVSAEKRIWHCFGCHESGDLIKFVMLYEHIPFYEAVREIAERSGFPIVETQEIAHLSSKDLLNQHIRDVLYYSTQWFQAELVRSESAKSYLNNRSVSDDSRSRFQLGYCSGDRGLIELLQSKKIPQEAIEKSGLFFRGKTGELRVRFWERLLFPIADARGVVRGFGGRVMGDRTDLAKYINSEDSSVFNKRFLLYGFHLAKGVIQRSGSALIMEGYMDVLMAHQFGFQHAVGTMGTALTREQVTLLKSVTQSVYLVFDSDVAGQNAIEKSMELLLQEGISVRIVVLPYKDPADTFLAIGKSGFQSLIDSAQPVLLFKFHLAKSRVSQNRIEDVPKILEEVLPLLRLERDSIVQNHYIQTFAKGLNISEDLIVAKLKNIKYSARSGSAYSLNKIKKNKYELAQEAILFFLATDFELRNMILENLSESAMSNAENRELMNVIAEIPQTDLSLAEAVKDPGLQKKLRYILVKGETDRLADQKNEWTRYVSVLNEYQKNLKIDDIKRQIKELEDRGDEESVNRLMTELSQLVQ